MNRYGKYLLPGTVLARIARVIVVCVVVTLLFGCGETPTTVNGLVTLDGKPLAIGDGMRGSVVFQPTVTSGNTLTGVIDEQGRYQLSSGGSMTVTPSVYWVTVSATELIPATDEQPTGGKLMTPAKYASATDSGFRVEVVQGENEVNLSLVTDDDEAALVLDPESPIDATTPKSDVRGASASPHSDESVLEKSNATE